MVCSQGTRDMQPALAFKKLAKASTSCTQLYLLGKTSKSLPCITASITDACWGAAEWANEPLTHLSVFDLHKNPAMSWSLSSNLGM